MDAQKATLQNTKIKLKVEVVNNDISYQIKLVKNCQIKLKNNELLYAVLFLFWTLGMRLVTPNGEKYCILLKISSQCPSAVVWNYLLEVIIFKFDLIVNV